MEKNLAEADRQLDAMNRDGIESLQKLELMVVNRLSDILKKPTGLDTIQLRELDLLLMEPMSQLYSQFSVGRSHELWEEWNRHVLDKITETIDHYQSKRILITVGWAHKFWLWNNLSKRTDITLLDLNSLRQTQRSDMNQ